MANGVKGRKGRWGAFGRPGFGLAFAALGNALQSVSYKILLVDDDVEFVEMMRDYLSREGFIVNCAWSGEAAIDAARLGLHDLLVLDVMMPGVSGIEALAKIRESSTMPVLMLTARGDDDDRILGLELGADDYVAKPCTPRELAARLRSILRRTQASETASQASVAVGPITVWPGQRRASMAGRELALTSTEFSMMALLVRRAGHLVTREELSQEALARPVARFDRTIDVHICRIRQKLGAREDGQSFIRTVVHKGYQLVLN